MRTALIFPGVEPAVSRALAAVVYGTVTMLFGVLFSTDVSSSVKVPPQADERIAYDRLTFVYAKGIAYGYQMGLRPQTMCGIADSPVGLAAYLLDHDARSYELIARAFAGQPGGLTRDDVLDNITLTWLTNTAISSARTSVNRTTYEQIRSKCPLSNTFRARSEGYRSWPCRTHNPKVRWFKSSSPYISASARSSQSCSSQSLTGLRSSPMIPPRS